MEETRKLAGRVAVVAGATRGAGRGIAAMLGEAEAIVYCTGRSTRSHGATPGRPETIEETADEVSRRGGKGIAVQVDHLEEDQVAALFGRIQDEQGKLDILVNDIWGGDRLIDWSRPFWQQSMATGAPLIESAILTHLHTSRHAAPILVRQGYGLIVEVTDGEADRYRGNLLYDLVKNAVNRLAFGMAEELRPHGVAAIAVTPGYLRSEAMLDHFGVTEATWREGARIDPHFSASETPYFVGRAVAALASDPDYFRHSGSVLTSWGLAETHGFSDVDGRRPHWGRHYERHVIGAEPIDLAEAL